MLPVDIMKRLEIKVGCFVRVQRNRDVSLKRNKRPSYLGEMPVFGSFRYGIGDVCAGRPEEHEFVGSAVHHVEEGLDADRRVALKQKS